MPTGHLPPPHLTPHADETNWHFPKLMEQTGSQRLILHDTVFAVWETYKEHSMWVSM